MEFSVTQLQSRKNVPIVRRDLLQRLATGFCLLVTAFYRYLLVCHPNSNLGPKIYKPMAAVLVLTPVISLVVSSLDTIVSVLQMKYNSEEFLVE